jgi:O-methyltransferase involved in polyketide biosynthesis
VSESRAPEIPPPGIDISRPNIARVYDYLLGGKDNFTVDRELAGQLMSVNPGMEEWARSNRAFVVAAAARAAREGGIAQFLDLGAGLPTHPAVHEAVRAVNPAARVAYVDFDPVAVIHSRALLTKGDGLAAVQADLTDPEAVLADPELAKILDLSQPVGVILGGVAHFLSAAVMRATTAAYVSRIRPGSWLMIAAGHAEDEGPISKLKPAYTAADAFRHTHEEFRSFFAGTEIVPPGIVEARRWIADLTTPPPDHGLYVRCGAGVKR